MTRPQGCGRGGDDHSGPRAPSPSELIVNSRDILVLAIGLNARRAWFPRAEVDIFDQRNTAPASINDPVVPLAQLAPVLGVPFGQARLLVKPDC